MDEVSAAAPRAAAASSERLARWRGRSRGVRRLRLVLPLAMGALVLAVIGWIAVQAMLADKRSEGAGSGGLHMSHPRFFGRDEGGRAFTLEAEEAVRDAGDLDRVTLTRPHLTLDHGAERATTAASPHGVYSERAREVVLTGGVDLDDGKGTRLHSPSAAVNTHTGDVDGRGNVTGESPLGRFQASSYLVRGKGAEVVFTGGVKAHLFNGPEGARP